MCITACPCYIVHKAGHTWLDVHNYAHIIMFSTLYGQHTWLYVFLGFTSNYTLYTQYKWLYVLNYTHIIPTHI